MQLVKVLVIDEVITCYEIFTVTVAALTMTSVECINHDICEKFHMYGTGQYFKYSMPEGQFRLLTR